MPHSEMAVLGGYLMAKLLWNPNYDENVALGESLEGYYGKAAEPMRTYLDLLIRHAQKENLHVAIWSGPDSPHLANDLLVQADGLWDAAEKAVAESPEVLRRVQMSRMSVDYAIVERARIQAKSSKPVLSLLGSPVARRFQPLVERLAAGGVTRLCEGTTLDVAPYRRQLAAALGLKPRSAIEVQVALGWPAFDWPAFGCPTAAWKAFQMAGFRPRTYAIAPTVRPSNWL